MGMSASYLAKIAKIIEATGETTKAEALASEIVATIQDCKTEAEVMEALKPFGVE